MKSLRITLLAAGILAVLIGLVWVGQGTGYFPYPSSSFMIDQMPWAYRGAAVAFLGLITLNGQRHRCHYPDTVRRGRIRFKPIWDRY